MDVVFNQSFSWASLSHIEIGQSIAEITNRSWTKSTGSFLPTDSMKKIEDQMDDSDRSATQADPMDAERNAISDSASKEVVFIIGSGKSDQYSTS